jgi:hypothetical protein
MANFARRGAILVTPVDLIALPEWEPGPVPFADGDTVATADVRRTYFNERTGAALYGPARAHRWAGPGERLAVTGGELELLALEIVQVPGRRADRNGLLVVHGHVAADGLALVDTLQTLCDVGSSRSPLRAWCDRALAGCGVVGPGIERAMTMTIATPRGPLDAPLPPGGYAGWSADLQWLWLLASATSPEAYLPAPEAREALSGSLVHLSAGWQALVLRDGTALLGSGADMSPVYRLFDDAELHFRSIYLDALLLAQMQRLVLTQIADDVAAVVDPALDPERLLDLERELTTFRNVFWWRHLGPQWHGNELLHAYQRQHAIPELLDQVAAELGDYSRKVERAAAQRSEALLGVLAVVGLPVGVALELTHVLGIEEPIWVVLALVIAFAFVVAILLTAPGRNLVRLWLLVGRRERRNVAA